MGQSVCGQQGSSKLRSIHATNQLETEIPADEGGDNPMRQKIQNNFLQTDVIASWNILKEKPLDLLNIESILASVAKKSEKSKQASPETNFQALDNQENRKSPKKSLDRKKYRVAIPSSYENIEIDISGFIKVRNENIENFYDFQQKLGEGTFGNVYRGIEKKSGEVRAIKALKKTRMNVSSKMSFAAEIELLKKLDHPNIIKLYDLFLFDGNYYVVTEYCAGGSLQDFYDNNEKQLKEPTVKIIMKQLISTLAYLYNQGIVHRDLKLENMVFLKPPSEDGMQNLEIKLIDFGTAIKVCKHKKNQSGLVGTLLYIAPEFTKGFFTQKCDIWSAGVILFQFMFQEYPFKGKTEKDILNEILTKSIDWPTLSRKFKIPKQALEMIQGMLDKNYLTRLSVKCLLQNAWFNGVNYGNASNELRSSVKQSLVNYGKKNNFVSLMESFLTFKKTTQKERQELSKMFFEIDKDQSGIIQTNQLVEFYHKNFPETNDADILNIVNNIDKNKSGKIDFNEFLTAVRKKNDLYAEESLKEAFDFVDKDKTRYISKRELKMLLKMAEKAEIEQLFKNLDQNNDNQISFDQFKTYLLNY